MNRKLTVTIISETDVEENPSEYMSHLVNFLCLDGNFDSMGDLVAGVNISAARESGTWEDLCGLIEADFGPCHFAPVEIFGPGEYVVRFYDRAPSAREWDRGVTGIAFLRDADLGDWAPATPRELFRNYADMLDMYINNRGAYWFQVVGIDAAELAHVRGDSFLAAYIEAHGERLDSLCGAYYEEQYPSIMVRDIGLGSDLVLAKFGPYANQLIPFADDVSLDDLLAGPAA